MPLNWSSKKQISYFLVFLAIFTIGVFILIFPYINKPPTCFDGKQNGDETGVDCGGDCARVCTNEAYGLVVSWSRAFSVSGGTYNLAAFVENQNTEAGIYNINYEFNVYDDDNVFIGRVSGSSFITPNTRNLIFEPSFDAGNRVPARVDFRFTNFPNWLRVDRSQRNAMSLDVQDIVFSNTFSYPRLEASVINNTLMDIRDIEVYAILYDSQDNVINTSKTFIQNLIKNSREKVYFTWPIPFKEQPSRIEILPQVNIFEINQI